MSGYLDRGVGLMFDVREYYDGGGGVGREVIDGVA